MPVRDYHDIGVVMAPPIVCFLLLAVCFRPVMICQMLFLQVAMVNMVLILIPLMPVLGVPIVIPLVLLMVVIIGPHCHGYKQAGAQQTRTQITIHIFAIFLTDPYTQQGE